jgi:sensor c-di-GMP phosphodiesterase-like protein
MFSLDEIQAGLKSQEFFLEYLPTMSLSDNRCVGAETLIRWRHDNRVVPPLEFIPLVEYTPISGTLTYWVLETVAKELGGWIREHDDIHISINVPPELLGRGGLRYTAEKSNLQGLTGKFMLEITERGLPDALGVAAIATASRSGVLIALDDVDVNQANLVVLSRLNAAVVKVDKSFADRMLQQDWTPQDIDGLAALIHTGNCKVIVEGIETAVQVEILKEAGVELVQGFYFSRPLPAAEFIDYYSAHH